MLDDLYFIQAESGKVKIGRAKRPGARLKELQVGSPERLELIEVLEGRGYEEKVWHSVFCVERLHGEWFEFSDQLDDALAWAMHGKRWWDHVMPPPSYPLSDDPDERDDDIVDWHIAIHIALAGAAEKAGLTSAYAGKAILTQDNGKHPWRLAPNGYEVKSSVIVQLGQKG